MSTSANFEAGNPAFLPKIKVIGVGGAGNNAVSNMIRYGLSDVEFIVANTDLQALTASPCEIKIKLGNTGLGAGAMPEVGRDSAEEQREEILDCVKGAHVVFVAAGMGGGTGTGAAPVVARIAKDLGIMTIGVVTKPFVFEGSERLKIAEKGIQELEKSVDTLIVVSNQNLFRIANEQTSFSDAFIEADSVLFSGVKCVTDLFVKPGLINLDLADVRSVIAGGGMAMIGSGEASGPDRAKKAVEIAIMNPLLDDITLDDAQGLLLNVYGGKDMKLFEVNSIAQTIADKINPETTKFIIGSTIDDEMEDRIRVSVVATGVKKNSSFKKRQEAISNEVFEDINDNIEEFSDSQFMRDFEQRIHEDKEDLRQKASIRKSNEIQFYPKFGQDAVEQQRHGQSPKIINKTSLQAVKNNSGTEDEKDEFFFFVEDSEEDDADSSYNYPQKPLSSVSQNKASNHLKQPSVSNRQHTEGSIGNNQDEALSSYVEDDISFASEAPDVMDDDIIISFLEENSDRIEARYKDQNLDDKNFYSNDTTNNKNNRFTNTEINSKKLEQNEEDKYEYSDENEDNNEDSYQDEVDYSEQNHTYESSKNEDSGFWGRIRKVLKNKKKEYEEKENMNQKKKIISECKDIERTSDNALIEESFLSEEILKNEDNDIEENLIRSVEEDGNKSNEETVEMLFSMKSITNNASKQTEKKEAVQKQKSKGDGKFVAVKRCYQDSLFAE